MTQQQNVLAWLKDAHAMEQGAVLTLENHAAAAQGYPEVQSKLHEHAEATRQHAILVERCIERLGGHPSVLKEAIGTVMGKVQGVANLPAQDTVVKNALGDLAAEHFEIASYTSLIAAAEQAGDEETANVCRRILRDEEEMADWLRAQIPVITRQFLAEQTGEVSQGVQAQVVDKAKQTVEELKAQGKELAAKAKQGGKDALIVSGALLAGAGAGLLLVQALRSGSGEQQRAQDRHQNHNDDNGSSGAYNGVQAGYEGGSLEPLAPLDLRSESLDAGEPFVQAAERSTMLETEPEDQASETPSQNAESSILGFQSREPSLDASLGLDADIMDTALMGSDVQDLDVQDLDELSSLDAEVDADVREAEIGGSDIEGASAPIYTEVWLIPGPYSGLGPSGYDSAGDPVGQEVYSRLTQHGQVDASSIEIVIDNGEVLLDGTVDSEETKRLAEEAVATISGVDSVQNLLQVQTSRQDS